ncbi:MAG: hypothetical protein KBC33_00215 [Candidatus Pacebacteria bacterium]|nr:hypothetical protein [Candidatus Paceibacterota bacterium]
MNTLKAYLAFACFFIESILFDDGWLGFFPDDETDLRRLKKWVDRFRVKYDCIRIITTESPKTAAPSGPKALLP